MGGESEGKSDWGVGDDRCSVRFDSQGRVHLDPDCGTVLCFGFAVLAGFIFLYLEHLSVSSV